MGRRRQEGEETKKHIAAIAKGLFAQKGYAATSIEDISSATGSSKGSIYYHFKSKEGLFLYLTEQSMIESIEGWEKKKSKYRTATDKLYGLADHIVEDMQDPLLNAVQEFVGSEAARPDVFEQLLLLMRKPREMYRSVLEEGMASGEFVEENVDDVALILDGLLAGMSGLYYEQEPDQIRRVYHKGIKLFLNGLKKT